MDHSFTCKLHHACRTNKKTNMGSTGKYVCVCIRPKKLFSLARDVLTTHKNCVLYGQMSGHFACQHEEAMSISGLWKWMQMEILVSCNAGRKNYDKTDRKGSYTLYFKYEEKIMSPPCHRDKPSRCPGHNR